MQEAGADAVLELAYTIADGIQYCRTGIAVRQFNKYLNRRLYKDRKLNLTKVFYRQRKMLFVSVGLSFDFGKAAGTYISE